MKSTALDAIKKWMNEYGVWVIAILVAVLGFFAGAQHARNAAKAQYADRYFQLVTSLLDQVQSIYQQEAEVKSMRIEAMELDILQKRIEFQEELDRRMEANGGPREDNRQR